jgi:hypothetical protein
MLLVFVHKPRILDNVGSEYCCELALKGRGLDRGHEMAAVR